MYDILRIKPDKFLSFEDLGICVDASAFYPSLEPFYDTGDIPFIRVADVNDFISYDSCIKIPQYILEDKEFNTLKTINKGDIVITKGGSVGRIALVDRYTAVTRDLIFINSSILESQDYVFLYLFLLSDFAYNLMIQSSSMTAQPHLTLTLIKSLPIFKGSFNLKQKLERLYNQAVSIKEESQTLYSQAEQLLLEELGLKDWQPSTENINVKSFKDSFLSTARLDAEYYQKKYDEIEDKILSKDYFILKDYFDVKSSPSPSEYQDKGVAVIKTKNVRIPTVDFENLSDYTEASDLIIKKDDLIFASMGVGSLGRVSYIDGVVKPATIDGTLKLFRAKEQYRDCNFEIPTLLFLTSKIGQELIYKYIIGSTGIISISKESIENLIVPVINDEKRIKLSNLVLESISLKKQSNNLLEVAKRAVEIAIEQNEDAAMEYINKNIE